MSLQQFITNKIINRVKLIGKFSSEPKKSKATVVSLISAVGVLSSLLLHIPSKIGIGGMYAYAQQQQQQQQAGVVTDPLSSSLQIAQSKVQAATSPGAWGHGVPSLHNLSNQDLLTILGITSIGCIAAYLIIRIMLSRAKEKEEEQENSKMTMY